METKPINPVNPPAFNPAENNNAAANKNAVPNKAPQTTNNNDSAKTAGIAAAAAGVAGVAAGAAGYFVGSEISDAAEELTNLEGLDVVDELIPDELADAAEVLEPLVDALEQPAPAPAPAPAPEPEPIASNDVVEPDPIEEPFPEPEQPQITVEPDPAPIGEEPVEPVVPEEPVAVNEEPAEVNPGVDEEVDELLAGDMIDENDIDTPEVFNFTDMEEVATIDGDLITAATFTDEAGNEFAMIDLDNDGGFDIIIDNEGDLVSYVNGITTDDVMEELTEPDSYLAADDTDITSDFSDDMMNDLIS